jgi:nicotinate-nucleotide adenylyltransferase
MKALFGGSFNPIHLGHLRIAEDIREHYKLDKIIFIPAYQSPLKSKYSVKPEDRLNMVRLAVKDNPHFEVDDIEIKNPEISYTIKTIFHYKNLLGYNPIFIVGTDAFLKLHEWKEPKLLLENTNFIVVAREDIDISDINSYLKYNFCKEINIDNVINPFSAEVYFFKSRRLDISATEIRERVKENKSIKYLVPPEVEKYIYEKELYKD